MRFLFNVGGVISALLYLSACSSPVLARPNEAWEAQRIQAEQAGDEDALRKSRYVSSAGTLQCVPSYFVNGEPVWSANCPEGSTFRASCCGEADAYEADDIVYDPSDGTSYAVLTCYDPRNCEEIKGKVLRPPGTKFRIPVARILVNHDPINNTGHGWIWISPNATDDRGDPMVYCYSYGAGG